MESLLKVRMIVRYASAFIGGSCKRDTLNNCVYNDHKLCNTTAVEAHTRRRVHPLIKDFI